MDDLTTASPSPQPFSVQCTTCEWIFTLPISKEDLAAWRGGKHAQDAFPHLTDDQRELLISRTCGPCFNKMFPEEG